MSRGRRMSEGARLNWILLFYISISILGLLTTSIFALNASTPEENFTFRKPLVGSIFALICMSGTVAALFPKECSGFLGLPGKENSESSSAKNLHLHKAVRGHHPDCRNFSTHTIQIRDHILCSGCTGLVLGATIALSGTIFYFFGNWRLEEGYLPTVLIGQAGVTLCFVPYEFKSSARLVLNAFFVLGAYLILIAVDMLRESIFVDLYLIGLIVFWIWTRTLLSQWGHRRICSSCNRAHAGLPTCTPKGRASAYGVNQSRRPRSSIRQRLLLQTATKLFVCRTSPVTSN